MKFLLRLFAVLFLVPFYLTTANELPVNNSAAPDRQYTLRATMLGYFDETGVRNPVLRAQKGETVRITIINGEPLTHDIALEKAGIISETIIQTGATTSIEFVATESDIYYCSIPGHRLAGMEGKFEVVDGPLVEEKAIAGELPKKDGRELNLNFEQGNLLGSQATGDAFNEGLISEDPSPGHNKDTKMGMEGQYFVTSGGTKSYAFTGTLTSEPFKVTHPFASFKVSGGALEDTRVELVKAEDKEVFFTITGSG